MTTLDSVGDSRPTPDEGFTQPSGLGVTRDVARNLIAWLIESAYDHTVKPVVDWLSEEKRSTVDSIVDEAVSDPARVAALAKLGPFDEMRHSVLDRVAALAAEAVGTHRAAVSIVYANRQILVGYSAPGESPRDRLLVVSFCKFAVASRETLIIENTKGHPLFVDHPATKDGILAYAGVPLIEPNGNVLGALFTWDNHPRHWSGGQLQILHDLADVALWRLLEAPPDLT